jgi:hypothetical protein
VHSVVVLEDIELIPVLELEPTVFAADDRPLPSGTCQDMREEWCRYWLDSLADSGITGLMAVERGSWNVPTSEFTDPTLLGRVLEVIFQKRLEGELPPDWGPLNGGLALRCQSQSVLIEPGCCADLGDVAGWRKVVGYRQAEWRLLPIGHPSQWVLYRTPRLIISDLHEAVEPPPTARWAICPDQLQVALVAAEIELERFAGQIAGALPSRYEADARRMGRTLAGLNE